LAPKHVIILHADCNVVSANPDVWSSNYSLGKSEHLVSVLTVSQLLGISFSDEEDCQTCMLC